MTKAVLLEIVSKPDGPGIDGGTGAYVHVFYQEDKSAWSKDVFEFVEYYGYQIIKVEEPPVDFIPSTSWSEENLQMAEESRLTGFPRFGIFHVFE